MAIDGADPGDFAKSSDSCSSATVAPAASCSIQTQFEPKGAGARTASVIVSGNAPGDPADGVSLTGTGVVATPGEKTGERAAAKKRCKKKFPKGSEKREHCLKKAKKKPV